MIPALSHTNDAGGVKKPVRYGTRIRNKQKKEVHQSGESDQGKKDEASSIKDDSMPLEEDQEKEAATKGVTGVNVLNVVLFVSCVLQEEMFLQKIKFLIVGRAMQPAQKRYDIL